MIRSRILSQPLKPRSWYHCLTPFKFHRYVSSAVRIIEVGPRDGLQNIPVTVPTTTKVELINKLHEAGLTNIEATSFVSPKWVPQMSDGADVMQKISHLRDQSSLRFSVLTPNKKGFENAKACGAKEVVVFASATEAFSTKNQNCTVDQALQGARVVVEQAKRDGLWVRGVVSCIFADPYSGPTDSKDVLYVVKQFLEMGCDEVGLGDTLGQGTPAKTKSLLELILREVQASKLTGHFHDTYGQGVANVAAAYDMGLRTFDSSIAGLGGCPFAPGAKGNVATEDVIYSLANSGIDTGVDLEKLALVGDWISKQLGIPNNSRAGAAIAVKMQTKAQGATRAGEATKIQQAKAQERSKSQEEKNAEEPAQLVSATKSLTESGLKFDWFTERQTDGYKVARAGNMIKITLTRPKNGNAMTTEMLVGLTQLFKNFAADTSIFQIVLAAEGKFFCTGMDLTGDSRDDSGDYHDKIVDLFAAIDNAPQTTIAAIHGPCYGGGVGLGFVCDVRLVSAAARWTLSEVKLGMSPAIISKYMAREWSIPFCREVMLSGREVTPQELQRIGAIHGIADTNEDLDALVDNYLQRLRVCAPKAAATCKQLMRNSFVGPGSSQQDDFIRKTFDNMLAPGSEGQYGIKKFQQKIRNVDWSQFWARQRTKL